VVTSPVRARERFPRALAGAAHDRAVESGYTGPGQGLRVLLIRTKAHKAVGVLVVMVHPLRRFDELRARQVDKQWLPS
jgi:hypothetical protein